MSNTIIIGNLPFLMFSDGNEIIYWQDFSQCKGIPSNIKFFPEQEINNSIVFLADRCGILKNNPYNLEGQYGNGAIYISIKDLPADIIEWSRTNFLKK